MYLTHSGSSNHYQFENICNCSNVENTCNCSKDTWTMSGNQGDRMRHHSHPVGRHSYKIDHHGDVCSCQGSVPGLEKLDLSCVLIQVKSHRSVFYQCISANLTKWSKSTALILTHITRINELIRLLAEVWVWIPKKWLVLSHFLDPISWGCC